MVESPAGETPSQERNPSRRRSAAILAALAFLLSAPLSIGALLAASGAAGFDEQGNMAFAVVCGIAAILCIVWRLLSRGSTQANHGLTGTARYVVMFLILGAAAMSKLAAAAFASLSEGEALSAAAAFSLLTLFALMYLGAFAVCSLCESKRPDTH